MSYVAKAIPGLLTGLLLAAGPLFAAADPTTQSLEQRLQQLEQRQQELERQDQQKDAQVKELQRQVDELRKNQAATRPSPAPAPANAPAGAPASEPLPAPGAASGAGVAFEPSIEKPAATAELETSPQVDEVASPLAPGTGLMLASSKFGTVKLGIYALFRGIDQEPQAQTLTDHLGNQYPIDTRRDFQLHRILIPFTGWLYDPKFTYGVTIWTVNDTEQVRVIGAFQYKFAEQFALGAGVGSMPGTRSLNYSHPFWFGHDRVMADEFFRSGFTSGVWATGNLRPDLFYRVMVGNNISTLGINASKNTRSLAYGGTMAWMPTTGEFGPSGGYDDFEMHDRLATRFGFSIVSSPNEDRASQPSSSQPDATQIRLADSLLLFQSNSLGPGVTVQKADYETQAVDASFKYRGWALDSEFYHRTLGSFVTAVGSLPIPTGLSSISDHGFMVQTGYFFIPRTLEMYLSGSMVFPDTDLGFRRSSEVLAGANWFWTHTRLQRANLQVINVTRSATSSTFGYYTGGLTGWIIAADVSMMF